MAALFDSILTASFHGSIVIGAVLVLRLILRKAPKKYICWLWLLAGLRLLMPFQVQSEWSLQPDTPELPVVPPGLVLLLYIAVALGFLIYSLAGYAALRQKVRFAVKIPGGWEAESIETAFILGFVRPRIYIPMGMDEDARKHILAHERTHLDKGDHWIKMVGFVALALHWFNPLVWIAYVLLCKDIEMACDERVVQFMEPGERQAYSAALLDCSTSRISYAASPVAFGEVSVKSRILSILNYRKPSFWVGLTSVAAVGFVTLCLVTSPTQPPEIVTVVSPELPETVQTIPAPPPEPASPWGLSVIADPLSSTTMKLYTGVDVDGIPWDGTPVEKKSPYWLERWDGAAWEELYLRVEEPRYEGSHTMEHSRDNIHSFYHEEELDWTVLYGPLTEGYYRIGIQAERQGQTETHYAQFRIWVNTLSDQQAQAIDQCKKALERLLQKESWSVRLYRSNQEGTDLPVRTVYKSYSQGRVDSYVGDYCYNSYYCDITEAVITSWAEDFRLDENKRITFEGGTGSQEIRFVTTWEDVDGRSRREVNSYSFAADGSLEAACREEIREDGAVSRKSMAVGEAHWPDTLSDVQTPKDSQQAMTDSPWGIFFRVDDDYLSTSGGEVWIGAGEHMGVIPYTTDGEYWLEKKTADKWEKLHSNGTPRWDDKTFRLRSQNTVIQVDWTPYYGKMLSPGLYRMGKHFYNGEEAIIQYAEFKLYPQGNFAGNEAGGPAILRINAALERVRAGDYHIIEKTSGGFRLPEQIQTVYWKHDGICVTDYYEDSAYMHSGLWADPEDDLFYDQWMWVAGWNEPRNQVFFMDGASKISQEEISFATAMTGDDRIQELLRYSVFFDANDNITRIEYYSPGYYYGTDDRKTTFFFEDTSQEEIAAWVQKIQDQQ